MLRAISSFAAGRRKEWFVLAAWVIVGFSLPGQVTPRARQQRTRSGAAVD